MYIIKIDDIIDNQPNLFFISFILINSLRIKTIIIISVNILLLFKLHNNI